MRVHSLSICHRHYRLITIALMLRLRALLLVLIACLLPLQTALACAMQLCHDATQQVVVQDNLADAHCHSHEADVTTAAQAGTACEDCGVCHLAGTGFLLTDGERLAVLVGIDVLVPQPLATPRSHITEPSLHPPRNRA
jgi:hypothetical protein